MTSLPQPSSSATGQPVVVQANTEVSISPANLLTLIGGFSTSGGTITGDVTVNGKFYPVGGISFGSVVGASVDDLSKHIALWGTSFGISITSNHLNMLASSSSYFSWYSGTQLRAEIDTNNNLTLINTIDSATAAPSLILRRQSATPAAADYIGGIAFQANNSTPANIGYGTIGLQIDDPTAASEDATMYFNIYKAGTNTRMMDLDASGVVIPSSASNFYLRGNATIGAGTYNSADANTGVLLSNTGVIYSKRAGTSNIPFMQCYQDSAVAPVLVACLAASGNYTILSNEGTGPGILLRPTSYNSGTGQATLTSAGQLSLVSNLLVGATSATSTTVEDGWIINAGGYFYSKRINTTNQSHCVFMNNAAVTPTTVGTINTNGSGTTYNPTSDERLKDFIGPLDPLVAIDIIKRDPAREFNWKVDGSYAVGWGAQTSYKVNPYLANPPMRHEDDDPEKNIDDDPHMHPWGIDPNRRTPYLWAALGWALDKIDQLEARIAVLEGG